MSIAKSMGILAIVGVLILLLVLFYFTIKACERKFACSKKIKA